MRALVSVLKRLHMRFCTRHRQFESITGKAMSESGCVRTFAFWCLTETVGEAERKHFDSVNMAVAVKQCHSTF